MINIQDDLFFYFKISNKQAINNYSYLTLLYTGASHMIILVVRIQYIVILYCI